MSNGAGGREFCRHRIASFLVSMGCHLIVVDHADTRMALIDACPMVESAVTKRRSRRTIVSSCFQIGGDPSRCARLAVNAR